MQEIMLKREKSYGKTRNPAKKSVRGLENTPQVL